MSIVDKNKKLRNRIIIGVLLICTLIPVCFFAVELFKNHNNNDNNNDQPTSGYDQFGELEEADTLNDVDAYFALSLSSDISLDSSSSILKIANQLNEVPQVSITQVGDKEYLLNAPKEGYISGDTYRVELLDEHINFVLPALLNKRIVTFTAYTPDVLDVAQNNNVKDITTDKVFAVDFDNKINVGQDFIDNNNLKIDDVVILSVYDEFGFTTKNAYKILEISGDVIIVDKPDFAEVFDEFNVKSTFDATYEEQYFRFYSNEEIAEKLAQDEFVKGIMGADEPKKDQIEVSIEPKINDGSISIDYEVKIPIKKFFEEKWAEFSIYFTIKGKVEFKLGTVAQVDLGRLTFNLGANVSITNEYKFSLIIDKKIEKEESYKESVKSLIDRISKKIESSDFSVPIFNVYIPTPLVFLGFKFEAKIIFKLTIKIELEVSIKDTFSLEVGAKRDSDGVGVYFNKKSTEEIASIIIKGSLDARLGIELKFSGSVAGAINAGASFEIGAYGTLIGYARANSFMDLTLDNYKPSEDPDTLFSYGFYFEAGLYTNLSLFAEVDLVLYKVEVKHTLLEVKIPIIGVGNKELIILTPETESVLLDRDRVSLPNVKVEVMDMLTGKISTSNIQTSKLREVFDISTTSNNFGVDGAGDLYLQNQNIVQFDENVHLKMRSWRQFVSGNDDIDRPPFYYEIGTNDANLDINVSKEPIAVSKIELSYDRITNDTEYAQLHPGFDNNELQYNYRDDTNDMPDYQIGRLIRISPEIYPSNASYKTLDYTVLKGEEYIVGGANGIRVFEIGGTTYAEFRIIEDVSAIGNIDGKFDWQKEIKLSAKTNGYTDKYDYMNVTSIDRQGILASSIPVTDYEVTPVIDDNNVNINTITSGETVSFDILQDSLIPRNATRGVEGLENFSIFGPAIIDKNKLVKINNNAKVGEQIRILYTLSGVEREFFLSIVKRSVESVEIRGNNTQLKIGESDTISATLSAIDGGTPTINQVQYLIVGNNPSATLTELENNQAKITINNTANVGESIDVFAIIDGKRSNTITYTVAKIAVQSITLTTSDSLNVEAGSVAIVSASINPTNATFQNIIYSIVEGSEYATIDSGRGIIYFSNSIKGGEQIKVVADADGMYSNTIVFTTTYTEVTFVEFPSPSNKIRTGSTATLDAYVNADASNKDIEYSIVQGNEYATIIDDKLSVNANSPSKVNVVVRAIPIANRTLYVDKTFSVVGNELIASINGQYDFAEVLISSTSTVTAQDEFGNSVDNTEIEFSISSFSGNSYISINELGQIKFEPIPSNISSDDLIYTLNINYSGISTSIFLKGIIPPTRVELATSDGQNSESVMPNHTIELDINIFGGDNIDSFTNLAVFISGSATARVILSDSNTVLVQVNNDATLGSKIQVWLQYQIFSTSVESTTFEITVENPITDVKILDAPDSINIGSSIVLQYSTDVNTFLYDAVFALHPDSVGYAIINSKTGELSVADNADLIGKSIQVNVTINGISSEYYEINIVDTAKNITISSDSTSSGVEYIDEMDFYVLSPDGKFVINTKINGNSSSQASSKVKFILDSIAQQYLTLNNNILTLKSGVDINNGINATIIASIDGVSSNVIVIYIPSVISTVNDWSNINNNLAGYYVLANDIDFKGVEYTPIPTFTGIIDGAGHNLLNINIRTLDRNNNFGLIENNYGMIRNLNIINFALKTSGTTSSTSYIGTFAIKNYGYIINVNVQSTQNSMMLIENMNSVVGGIAAINYGTIRQAQNRLYIETLGVVGGIAGINTDGNIIDSQNTAQLGTYSYDENKAVYIGITGIFESGKVENSTNYGKVYDRERNQYFE